jgi:serine/threonine protein kinase
MEWKVFYFNTVPIRAETVQNLDRRREVYRLNLDICQELHGLPTVVIIKKMKDGWHDEFEQEKEAYERLKSLQGSVIPTFFGQGTFNGSPVIIISEVVGKILHDLTHSRVPISSDELQRPLEKAMCLLHSCGAEYLDQRLDNFFLCDTGEVMIVDLEQVRFPLDLEDWKHSVNYGGVGSLLYLFNDIRERKSRITRDNFLLGEPYILSGSLY